MTTELRQQDDELLDEATANEAAADSTEEHVAQDASAGADNDAAGGSTPSGSGGLPPVQRGGSVLGGNGMRLLLLAAFGLLVVGGAGMSGMMSVDVEGTTKSETYDNAVAYDQAVNDIGDPFAFQIDDLINMDGAEILKIETHPSQSALIQQATIRYRLGPNYVSDRYQSRWRGLGMRLMRTPTGPGFQVLAANETKKVAITSTFGPDRENAGGTIGQLTVQRPLSSREARAYEYPRDLPLPPNNSRTVGQGGGSGNSNLGRAWMVMWGGSTDALMQHYLRSFDFAGWEVTSTGDQRTPDGRTVYGYIATRGPVGYVMQFSAIPKPERYSSSVLFSPF